jgi:hypothetical protein
MRSRLGCILLTVNGAYSEFVVSVDELWWDLRKSSNGYTTCMFTICHPVERDLLMYFKLTFVDVLWLCQRFTWRICRGLRHFLLPRVQWIVCWAFHCCGPYQQTLANLWKMTNIRRHNNVSNIICPRWWHPQLAIVRGIREGRLTISRRHSLHVNHSSLSKADHSFIDLYQYTCWISSGSPKLTRLQVNIQVFGRFMSWYHVYTGNLLGALWGCLRRLSIP